MFRNLFAARANPTLKDDNDRTAIHLAAERGHAQVVEFLADKFKVGTVEKASFFVSHGHVNAFSPTSFPALATGAP